MSERPGMEHYGQERAETEKVALAARWRAQTTMTAEWIAERLGMVSRGYLNHLLYRRRKSREELSILRTDPFTKN